MTMARPDQHTQTHRDEHEHFGFWKPPSLRTSPLLLCRLPGGEDDRPTRKGIQQNIVERIAGIKWLKRPVALMDGELHC